MTDPDPAPPPVTELLLQWGRGDREALDRMLPVVYRELHQLASYYLSREPAGHTLQPTALVHEAYLRLVNQEKVDWRNRAQLLGLAASMMRRILLNHARDKAAAKRGGRERAAADRVSLSLVAGSDPEASVDLIALDDALERLAALDERKARVVELRYFGGLSVPEVASTLDVSVATVERDWSFARAWLFDALSDSAGDR